jgi:hypothetical protein
MGPGFKYHVVTVCAVFFALTVGLVVGSLYVSPQLTDRQTRAIRDLQATLNNDVLEQRGTIQRYQEFWKQAMPSLLERRLMGVGVALVQVGDYPELLPKVRETLQAADATILSETTIEREAGRPDELLKATLEPLHTEDASFPTDRIGLARLFASLITGAHPTPDTTLPPLTRAGLLHVERTSDYARPARYVLLIGGSREENGLRPKNVDAPLITELQKLGVTVLMCEPFEAKVSDIPAYREHKLAVTTIDNADQDIGLCSLVLALRGEKGSYGVKETADRLFPTSTP